MATYGASKHDNDDDLLDYVEDTTNVDRKADSSKSSKKGHYAGIHTVSFRDFVLKEELLRAIGDCGFEHPSEVQQACIPKAVLGSDVVCQAKSGMGKTAVFVLSALHRLQPVDGQVSILVLAHARELVYQIEGEFRRFCMHLPGPVKVLKSPSTCPHILVGSPGRILALVDEGALKLDHVKVFVLDECDRMLIESDMRSQVQRIFLKTPHDKQVMMFSATLPQSIRDTCRRFCQQPLEVFVDDESKLTLHGLQQYIVRLGEGDKNRKLTELLDALEFNQVIVFVAKIERARALCELLKEVGFPAIALHGKMEQGERIAVFDQFRSAKNARILVSTDLCGRGIDIEGINIVINYDFPENSDQYLHRVNRAARFGSKGLSISFVVTGNGPEARAARLNMTNRMNRASGAGVAVEAKTDEEVLGEVQSRFEVRVPELPDQIDVSSYMTEHL